jgi:hypothetical protein
MENTLNRGKIRQSIVAVVFAACCLYLPGHAQTGLTPAWLRWLGSGTNNFNCTSGRCNITDEIWFKSFSVSPGATVVNAGGNGPLIIRATGTCTIDGTIIANGSLTWGSGITGSGDFGGGGGGGGGGTAAGINGKSTTVISGIPVVNGGTGGSAEGGNGQNGVSSSSNQYHAFLASGSSWPGGGAAGGNGGSGGGAGGLGGTPVIFVCNTIEFSGTIDVSGGNGGNASASNRGAGGGGGGGYVVLAAVTFAANTGTINTNGGNGGTCNGFSNCGAGGSGGNGWSMSLTIQ